MSDLFTAVSGEVFSRYAKDQHQRLNYEAFHEFARDFDIFPTVCTQAALYRIFHSLSHFSEQVNPSTPQRSLRRDLSALEVSTMSPRALQHLATTQVAQTIDENLFVEAITLCALYPEQTDRSFERALKRFEEDLSPELARLALTRCLNLVQRMSNSGGPVGLQGGGRNQITLGNEIKSNSLMASGIHALRDLMGVFRSKKTY